MKLFLKLGSKYTLDVWPDSNSRDFACFLFPSVGKIHVGVDASDPGVVADDNNGVAVVVVSSMICDVLTLATDSTEGLMVTVDV